MTDETPNKEPQMPPKLKIETPDPDDATLESVEAKVKELSDRLANVGQQKFPEPPQWQYKRPKSMEGPTDDNGYKSLGVGLSIPFTLLGSMAVGFGLGWLVDHMLHLHDVFIGILGILGALFGLYATFVMLKRANLN